MATKMVAAWSTVVAHSQSFLANQKARNAIVEAENLLNAYGLVSCSISRLFCLLFTTLNPHPTKWGPI